MTLLLLIAIINLARTLKERTTNSKIWGVIINAMAIVLIATALIVGLLQ